MTAREQYAEVLAATLEPLLRGHYCVALDKVGWGDLFAKDAERIADALAAALPDPEQAESFVKMREAFKREHEWRREAEARTEQAVREALEAVLREFMANLPERQEPPDYIAVLTAAMLKVREARP